MARKLTLAEAKEMSLPGRRSLEIVSGAKGARAVTLRRVEIPVPRPGEPPRAPHCHADFEECIYVLSGVGMTEADSGRYPLRAGDTILIPPGEMHVTHNTGSEPLVLLCFFPVADVAARSTREAKP
jgi:mannose-6-phosphate isomerase-like protein (cupin superfamily)